MFDPITVLIIAGIIAGGAVCLILVHNRKVNRMDGDHISVELLRRARITFPTAENDIEAVDALYEHTFRECLYLSKEQSEPRATRLRQECIILFTLKNRLITESVRFERRYMGLAAGTTQTEPLHKA